MNEDQKRRLLDRIGEKIAGLSNDPPKTIDEIESLALDLRAQIGEVIVEALGRQASEGSGAEFLDSGKDEKTGDARGSKQCVVRSVDKSGTRTRCVHCRNGVANYKVMRLREIVTMAGTLRLWRPYHYCKRCQKGFCPLDVDFGLTGLTGLTGFSLRVQQEIARLSGELTYDPATQTLYRLTGISVSPSSAQRICRKYAAAALAEWSKVEEARNLPLAFELPSRLPTEVQNQCPDVLYVEADGIQTPMRGGSWREMKIGVTLSKYADGRMDQSSRYVNYMGESNCFGGKCEALAIKTGSLCAKRVVVLGDGAAWIKTMADKHFPCATHIVDFFHASEYAGTVARTVFGEGTAAAEQWLSDRKAEMSRSNWTAVHKALDAVRAKASDAVRDAERYFYNHADQMDYARYRADGLDIGSGLAESSCKRIVEDRLKGSGMRWSELGADVICHIRCLIFGKEWDKFVTFWNSYAKQTALVPL